MKRLALLAGALLAVGCGEAIAPNAEPHGSSGPRLDVAAAGTGGIAFDQHGGKLGETTTIWQDFRNCGDVCLGWLDEYHHEGVRPPK